MYRGTVHVISLTLCILVFAGFELNVFTKQSRNTIRVSNSLDADQTRQFVGHVRVQTVYIYIINKRNKQKKSLVYT